MFSEPVKHLLSVSSRTMQYKERTLACQRNCRLEHKGSVHLRPAAQKQGADVMEFSMCHGRRLGAKYKHRFRSER